MILKIPKRIVTVGSADRLFPMSFYLADDESEEARRKILAIQ